MPRDGSSIYHRPVGTDGVPNYPIESSKYNAYVADIEQDLNLPRPIVAGGTGASSADQALTNLSAEKAGQIVADWNSMVWKLGSFYAPSTAPGAPLAGHAFAGIAYGQDANNLILEARDLDYALSVTAWANSTFYPIGATARDTADNSVWKNTADHLTGAAPLTFAQYRATIPNVWVALPATQVASRYIRVQRAGVWSTWYTDISALAVRYDAAQVLTAGEQAQARKNIYAAPFDAMAYSGMQFNGGMEVSQQFGQNGNGATNSYSVDGWIMAYAGVGGGNIFGAQYNWGMNGFPSILAFSVGTAQAVMGANDLFYCRHAIEGLRSARLGWGTANAQPITIGFWTSHNRTGTWSGAISNGAANRCYAFTYTQTASNVFEYHTVTIPGDTTGTWAVDNTKGLMVIFAIAAGSAFTAPSANAWLAGNYVAAPGQVNGVALTTDVFRITGVVVLPGIEAPSAARSPLIMRPFDQELVTCRRYFRSYGGVIPLEAIANGQCFAATGAAVLFTFDPPMRAAPTVGFSGFFTLHNAATNVIGLSSVGTAVISPISCMFNLNVPSGLVAGDATKLLTADIAARMFVDARL
jgi:hypothetical protein